MKKIENLAVFNAFETYPPKVRTKLLALRKLILDTAATTDGVGEIEEILEGGRPAYLTSKSNSGSPIRIGWKSAAPSRYAMYFHSQTNLVDTFRSLFPKELKFHDNCCIVFDEDDIVPMASLTFCIVVALTYYKNQEALRRRKV